MSLCQCRLPIPHRHRDGIHWCDRCGGYLGKAGTLDGVAGTHEEQECGCPPCCGGKCQGRLLDIKLAQAVIDSDEKVKAAKNS